MRRLIVLGTTICLFLLGASAARAEVVTIDGTIKSVDAKKRTITIDSGSKTLTLDVSSKAKVSVDEKDASLDSLKPGQQVGLSYHDKLEVVLKIEVIPKNRLSPVGTWVEKRPGAPAGNRVRTFRKGRHPHRVTAKVASDFQRDVANRRQASLFPPAI